MALDLTGKKFGRLTCIKPVGTKNGHRIWLCQCSCGNQTEVTTGNLRSLHTLSCGCLQKENTSKVKKVHGLYRGSNGKRSKLYRVWGGMKERCINSHSEAFVNYGGRGIKVCDEWMEYEPFHKWAMSHGYLEGLSIERINNNGNYEPSNCKWISKSNQQANRRNNHYLTYKGQTKTVTVWAKELGIDSKNLSNRIRRGWSVERALTTPDKRKVSR